MRAGVAISGLKPAPECLDVSAWLGKPLQKAMAQSLSASAGQLQADNDLTVPADYKQHLAAVLTRRAVSRALASAGAPA